MMRIQPTAVEKLNTQHPGLQLDVDTMLQKDALLADIQSMLWEKYKTRISHQTLSKYKQKRWLPSIQRIQDRVERSQAIIRVIKKEGDSDFGRAYIFEQLDEAARRGDRIDPATLLREQRLRMELQLSFEQLEQTNRKLQAGIEKVALEFDAATRQASKHATGRSATLNDINSIRERVFGLPPIERATSDKEAQQQVAARIRDIFGVSQPGESEAGKE